MVLTQNHFILELFLADKALLHLKLTVCFNGFEVLLYLFKCVVYIYIYMSGMPVPRSAVTVAGCGVTGSLRVPAHPPLAPCSHHHPGAFATPSLRHSQIESQAPSPPSHPFTEPNHSTRLGVFRGPYF